MPDRILVIAAIDVCLRSEQHKPHIRYAPRWPGHPVPDSGWLWCLGYYDQQRQNSHVVVDLRRDELVEDAVEYVVTRRGPNTPPDWDLGDFDGRWIKPPTRVFTGGWPHASTAAAVATGRYEQRDDGAIAEVYEIRKG